MHAQISERRGRASIDHNLSLWVSLDIGLGNYSSRAHLSPARTEDSPILHAAVGLAKDIRGAGDEIEKGRRIPRSIAAAHGTRPGCAAPAATMSPSATYSSRKGILSVSRTRSWSNDADYARGEWHRTPRIGSTSSGCSCARRKRGRSQKLHMAMRPPWPGSAPRR
jgi:hypothetical protein